MIANNRVRWSWLAYGIATIGFVLAVTGCQEKPAAAPSGYYNGPMTGHAAKGASDSPPAAGSSSAAPK